jgi:hypothetical protein
MKKVLLLSAVVAGVGAKAQNFTAADTLQPGMTTMYFVMDSSALELNAVTGTGVTWDYSTLYGEIGVNPNDAAVTLASTAPNAADFPMAEYNNDLATFASIYFSNSADSTTYHGYAFTVDAYDVLLIFDNNPLKALTYPANVGTSYVDDVLGSIDVNGGTATGTATGSVGVNVDGFGTLNVGSDSYTNVLRVKMVESISTSITVFPFPPDNGTVTRTIYSYYQLSTDKQPLFMHATVDIASTLINQAFTAVYYSGIPAYASVTEVNDGDFSVYPNPANDVVTITTDGTADQLTVFNLNGQVITSFINPQAVETISVSELPAGTYLIQVTNEGVVTEEKLIVE